MSVNIMVIENDALLKKKLCDVLDRAGYNAVGVADYFEALSSVDSFRPDLFIFDIELPGVDGWEACLQMRLLYDIPAILIGEDSGVDMWVKTLESGADFYCKMPIGYLELPARVKAILRRYQRRRYSTVYS